MKASISICYIPHMKISEMYRPSGLFKMRFRDFYREIIGDCFPILTRVIKILFPGLQSGIAKTAVSPLSFCNENFSLSEYAFDRVPAAVVLRGIDFKICRVALRKSAGGTIK